MTKEEIYLASIRPVAEQIAAICREHKIANVTAFSFEGYKGEVLLLLTEDSDPSVVLLNAGLVLLGKPQLDDETASLGYSLRLVSHREDRARYGCEVAVKRKVYSEQVAPLVGQLLEACEKNSIAMLSAFSLGGEVGAGAAYLTEECNPASSLLLASDLLYTDITKLQNLSLHGLN